MPPRLNEFDARSPEKHHAQQRIEADNEDQQNGLRFTHLSTVLRDAPWLDYLPAANPDQFSINGLERALRRNATHGGEQFLYVERLAQKLVRPVCKTGFLHRSICRRADNHHL